MAAVRGIVNQSDKAAELRAEWEDRGGRGDPGRGKETHPEEAAAASARHQSG